MSITFTGYMTLKDDVSPHLNHTALNTLLATAPENLTRAGLHKLHSVFDYTSAADPTQTLYAALLPHKT